MPFTSQTTIQEITDAYPGALNGLTFLITGATSGLGLAFAKFIAEHHAGCVVLAGRSEDKLAKAEEEVKSSAVPGTIIKTLILDLESQESIRNAAEKITSGSLNIPKIDVLLNNGGVLGPAFRKIDGYESQFFINHLSHYLFTNLILSHISSPGGRIISVSSVGHGISHVRFDDINFEDGEKYHKFVAYGQSKSANILFSVGLNKRVNEKGIQSFAVNPGNVITTNLTRHLDLVADGIKDKDGNWKDHGVELISIERGIATYLYASVSPEIDGKGGSYLEESQVKETARPMTKEDADKLWELSNRILGTSF